MLHIAGGVYSEICQEPIWNQVFGSGGRAAAAVATSHPVILHTYAHTNTMLALARLSNTFGFNVSTTTSYSTPQFHYYHGLSQPQTITSYADSEEPLKVKGSAILRFGMIEGTAIVMGDRVVYDPQSPSHPEPFHANGSSAKELAIVANESEVLRMTALSQLPEDLKSIPAQLGANILVVKLGPRGAIVVAEGVQTPIPPNPTMHVWPIGSGDVFSAVFASCWAVKKLGAIDAASAASLATAKYCSNMSLPPTQAFVSGIDLQIAAPGEANHPKVYVAGPFFDLSQRWMIREAVAAVESLGMPTFSPMRDVGIGNGPAISERDLDGLKKSTSMLAIIDGLDPGTLVEIGYARALDIPISVFTERSSPEDLVMLDAPTIHIVNDFCSSVYIACWLALGQSK